MPWVVTFWYHAAGFCHGQLCGTAREVCGSRRPQGTQTSVNGSRRVLTWRARRCKSAREQTQQLKKTRGVALAGIVKSTGTYISDSIGWQSTHRIGIESSKQSCTSKSTCSISRSIFLARKSFSNRHRIQKKRKKEKATNFSFID